MLWLCMMLLIFSYSYSPAITDFNGVAVENLVEFVLLRKMLCDEVKEFNIVNKNIHHKINSDGNSIMKKKIIYDRMLSNGEDEAFITLKDHKANFQNNPKVRLLNPAKNEIGCISKSILDKICLLYTSPSPRDKRQSRMPSSA